MLVTKALLVADLNCRMQGEDGLDHEWLLDH